MFKTYTEKSSKRALAIHLAAFYDDAESILKVNHLTLNEYHKGKAALHIAAENNSINAVKALLARGADVHALTEGEYLINSSENVLEIAAKKGHLEVVKILLDHSPELNKGKLSPLLNALQNDRDEVAVLLIEKGADISSNTILYKAVGSSYYAKANPGAVKSLIARGVKIDAVNEEGETALYMSAPRTAKNKNDINYPARDTYFLLANLGARIDKDRIKSKSQHRTTLVTQSIGKYTGTGAALGFDFGHIPFSIVGGILGFFSGLAHGAFRAISRRPFDKGELEHVFEMIFSVPSDKKAEVIAEIVERYKRSQSLASSDSSNKLLDILTSKSIQVSEKWQQLTNYMHEGEIDLHYNAEVAEYPECDPYSGDRKMLYKNNGKKLFCIIYDVASQFAPTLKTTL